MFEENISQPHNPTTYSCCFQDALYLFPHRARARFSFLMIKHLIFYYRHIRLWRHGGGGSFFYVCDRASYKEFKHISSVSVCVQRNSSTTATHEFIYLYVNIVFSFTHHHHLFLLRLRCLHAHFFDAFDTVLLYIMLMLNLWCAIFYSLCFFLAFLHRQFSWSKQ